MNAPELPSRGRSRTPRRAPAEPTGRRAPRIPFALLVTGLIVGGLTLLLALNTVSAANELRRNTLVDKDAIVAAEVQVLHNDVAASAAPANLAAAAVQLGMVPAGNPAFLVVGADGVARVMGRPKAVKPIPVTVPKAKHKRKPRTTAARTSRSASRTSSKTTSPGRTRTPAPTPRRTSPTPVVTLPGGPR